MVVIYNGERVFQSTCPARGTTQRRSCTSDGARISIHVPREGHDGMVIYDAKFADVFQSTCPARGTTRFRYVRDRRRGRFQSTCPARGTTDGNFKIADNNLLFQSTCPARGTTSRSSVRLRRGSHFNPRAPRGARRRQEVLIMAERVFQSTCPARGTTRYRRFRNPPLRLFQSTCPARGTT